MNTYLFAYGSLMNPKSLAHTLPGARDVRRAILKGYQRKMNAPFDGYAYLNIVPLAASSVQGVLIAMTRSEIDLFSSREEGYAITDVTDFLTEPVDGRAYAFIAPDIECVLKVPRSYLSTCTAGMSEAERERWIKETLMGEIEEDLEKPLYEFASD